MRRTYDIPSGELNIVALMDAFTIILVFLIQSYASDPTQLPSGDELRLPPSTTVRAVPELVPIVISKRAVLVNNQIAAPLVDGRLDAVGQRLVATALEAELAGRGSADSLIVAADKATPLQTIGDVLIAAHALKIETFRFAVLRSD